MPKFKNMTFKKDTDRFSCFFFLGGSTSFKIFKLVYIILYKQHIKHLNEQNSSLVLVTRLLISELYVEILMARHPTKLLKHYLYCSKKEEKSHLKFLIDKTEVSFHKYNAMAVIFDDFLVDKEYLP